MLQDSYTRNYFNIYVFQTLSILLGFASLFIVVPYLSSNKEIYGIYSICISVTVFFSYADLGFLSAGTKYAAECYTKNQVEGELKYLGFSHFILFVCMLLFSILFVIIGLHPEWMIKGLDDIEKYETAQKLFFILAIFAPATVLQRLPQMILSIRVKQYLYQQIQIVGNVVKIISAFYFFTDGRYDIVGYFLTFQLITLICSLLACIQIKRNLGYDFRLFWKYFHFSKAVFKNTYVLALSSLIVTVCWVLYYELDAIAIGKLFGAQEVAIYAVGFTILNFFRSLLGVLYSPFNTRFNHFCGQGNFDDLKHFYLNIIMMTFPVVVFPITVLIYIAGPLVLSWVGVAYEKSILISQWLIVCNIFAFIAYPAGMLLYALEKIKAMYIVNVVSLLVFWGGVGLTQHNCGIGAFAIFKFITFVLTGIVYLKITLDFLRMSLFEFIKRIIVPYLPSLALLGVLMFISRSLFISEKGHLFLFYNGCIIVANILISMMLALFTVPQLKSYILKMKKNL